MPYTLRQPFATILVYCSPNNPKSIWKKFEQAMSKDYTKLTNLTKENVRKKALLRINSIMESMGKDINNYALIDDKINLTEDDKSSKEMEEELTFVVSDKDLQSINKLNKEQKLAYDKIIGKIFSNDHGAFFIDGPGGTRKTYLYCTLLAIVRSKGYIALPVASSGVAASNLPLGRTSHSRFKLPINIDENTTCNIT